MNKTIVLEFQNEKSFSKICKLATYSINTTNQKIEIKEIGVVESDSIYSSYLKWSQDLEILLKHRRTRNIRFGNNAQTTKNLNIEIDKLYLSCNDSQKNLLKTINQLLDNNKLNDWLQLQIDDSDKYCTIVIKTNNLQLGSLPWEHCDIFNPYYEKNNLRFGLFFSTEESGTYLNHQLLNTEANHHEETTKVLVILGNESQIDLEFDEQEFENLRISFRELENRANVKVTTIKPNRADLIKALKEDTWNVIYYGGHSNTIENQLDGVFDLSDGPIQISELENEFKLLINEGHLKLLIANACQGLGTAFRLINLGLPYAIVMRQSVPDDFAHEYLKFLLESIVIGLPLSNAVQFSRPYIREAFDRGHKIPGASMFPVLCLNPQYISQLDKPIVQIEGLHPIAAEIKSLANLAKRRLEVLDYRDETAIKLQRFYADALNQKNIVNNKGTKEYIDPSKVTSVWRMSGNLIWEVTMSADVQGTNLIWGQGFVNIETGNSELLLDNRPFSWTGTEIIIAQKEIAQLQVPDDATLIINNGATQQLSITKLGILILEQEYRKFIKSKNYINDDNTFDYVRNFGGWLKDFNRKIFQKEFAILVANNQKQSLEELAYKALQVTPFGKHRYQLGITQFKIDTDDKNLQKSWKTLKLLIKDDNWDEKDKKYLKDKGVSEESWQSILVPDKVIVTEATRPEGEKWNPQIKTYYQQQEFNLS
jgi:hypothetical protein